MLEEKVKSEEVSLETDKITIYVVRHGSYTGSCMDDSGLTDLGRKQAHEVGRKIREDLLEKEGSIDDAIEKAIILTSPTPRCIETRDLILEEIEKTPEISCLPPRGAFYIFLNIKKLNQSSRDVALKWLKEARVATVPGSSFGKEGEGYLRVSFSVSEDKIKEAFERIRGIL